MFKKMLTLVLIFSMTFALGYPRGTVAHAATAGLSLSKMEFLPGESVEITVSETHEEWVEAGGFIGLFPVGGTADDYEVYEYLDSAINVFALEGFVEEGTYEARLYSCDTPTLEEELIDTVTFSVGGSAMGMYTMTLDSDVYEVDESIAVMVSGVPEFMIDIDAFVALYEPDAPVDQYLDFDYIIQSDDDLMLFGASEPGNYEVRAYSMENVTSERQLVATIPLTFVAPPEDAEEDPDEELNSEEKLPEGFQVILMQVGSTTMMINGDVAEVDPGYETTPQLTENGRVIVPIRAVVTALGGEISWNEATQELIMRANGNTVIMTIGQKSFFVNENEHEMDVAPEIMNGRTMIPLRAAGEALNCAVEWIEESQGVLISYTGE